MTLGQKTLFIIRGCSGSGKTTFASHLRSLLAGCSYQVEKCEADDFFYDSFYNYNFNVDQLHQAHNWCQAKVSSAMADNKNVILSNTSTTEKELAPYLALAEKYGYNVVSLVVENRHGNKSVHDVPEETLKRQEQRLKGSIKLI